MESRNYIRYTEAFKQQVVADLEAGKYKGPQEATKAYQIRGSGTVVRWLRRYGKMDLVPRQVTISTVEQKDELKGLKERVRRLEGALADAHMKGLLEESYLEIACERLGIDLAEFKKKHVTELSSEPKTKGKEGRL